MGAWDYGLYGNDEALNARGVALAKVTLPEDPRLFAGCVGLLALLEPEAHQFVDVANHAALTALPPGLREATMVAASIGASGPRMPYTERVRDILGIDASYGRVVDPLLELRETITVARSIRDRCAKIVDEGFAFGDTAVGGVVGVLLELRELGVATVPDLVDEWIESFDKLRNIGDREDTEFLREWSRSYRAALKLLGTEPDKKLLGSEPTADKRGKKLR